ncbi:hypothetical protein CEXT_548091 [Caerostris extrusa]|uniref:Uncharacterized protein n=1 Tax=Caerostris extrusa TaxID=172846 RepID=A0AAV4YDX2_CAEEX|nr:hypothetical protein CEXT_548091 [Caerostris extrusa]
MECHRYPCMKQNYMKPSVNSLEGHSSMLILQHRKLAGVQALIYSIILAGTENCVPEQFWFLDVYILLSVILLFFPFNSNSSSYNEDLSVHTTHRQIHAPMPLIPQQNPNRFLDNSTPAPKVGKNAQKVPIKPATQYASKVNKPTQAPPTRIQPPASNRSNFADIAAGRATSLAPPTEAPLNKSAMEFLNSCSPMLTT